MGVTCASFLSLRSIAFHNKFAIVEIMDAPGHKLVSPEGVLHLLPLDDRSILSFTKAHGLKDKKYLMKHLHVGEGIVNLSVNVHTTLMRSQRYQSQTHRAATPCAALILKLSRLY